MFSVSVPKLRGPRPRPAEVRPRRVEAWLSELPRADMRDSGQQLCQALFAQNRISLEADNRLNLMELYQPTAVTVVDALQRDYVMASFPLTKGRRDSVDLVNRLLSEMANGYKIVANDIAAHDKHAADRDELVLALQRAVYFLGQLLLNAYQSYTACPAGVWRELHQLYHFALAQQLVDKPVEDLTRASGEELTSIGDAYQQIVLVAAANPYSLLQGECARLYKMVCMWQCNAEIRPYRPKHARDPTGRFLLSVESDSAPIPLVKAPSIEQSDKLLQLNTIEVVREIHSILKDLERGAKLRALSSATQGADVGQGDLLRRVGRVLGGVNIRRRSVRTRRNVPTVVCIGINAVHFFASGEQSFDVLTGEVREATPARRVAEIEEQYIDLSDPRLGEESPQPSVPLAQTDWRFSDNFRHFPCLVTDECASGLCLQVQSPTDVRVRAGDPVGLQYPTADRWRVGVVRWMRAHNRSRLEIGVQMLAPELSPVAVRRSDDEKERDAPYIQALLLPANSALHQPESLLVPHGCYRARSRLYMRRSAGEPQLVKPLQILDRTGSYDQLLLALPR